MLRIVALLFMIFISCSHETTAPAVNFPASTDIHGSLLNATSPGSLIEIGPHGAGGREVLKMSDAAGLTTAIWYADGGSGVADMRLFWPGSSGSYTGIMPGSLGFIYDGGRYAALQMSKTEQPEFIVAGSAGVCRIEGETGRADMPAGYKVNGKQVIGLRQPGIDDAQSIEEVKARLNQVLAVMRAHGLIEPEGAAFTAKK